MDIITVKDAKQYLSYKPRAPYVRFAAEGVEVAASICERQGDTSMAKQHRAAALVLRKWLKHTYRGVTYYRDFEEATKIARAHDGARVVSYERGHAVQKDISGPYWNEESGRFE